MAPSSEMLVHGSRRWSLWRTRKERLEDETALVLAHRDNILARMEQAKAIGGLARVRIELSEILASLSGKTHRRLVR